MFVRRYDGDLVIDELPGGENPEVREIMISSHGQDHELRGKLINDLKSKIGQVQEAAAYPLLSQAMFLIVDGDTDMEELLEDVTYFVRKKRLPRKRRRQ